MFWKSKSTSDGDASKPPSQISAKQLAPPPNAIEEGAIEVLRVWAQPNNPQHVTLRTTWKDPGAWGLMLADVARHAAKAYELDGTPEEDALKRILDLFRAELDRPTDEPDQLRMDN